MDKAMALSALQLLAAVKDTRSTAEYVQEAARQRQEARRVTAQVDALAARLGNAP